MSELRRYCFHCGARLEPGGSAYRIHIQMIADFDGFIDGDDLSNATDAVQEADSASRVRTAEELTEQVYRERAFLFCDRCAERVWREMTEPSPSSS